MPDGSRNHVTVPDTIKLTFNLDIESTDKTRSIVNNVDRAIGVIRKFMTVCQKNVFRHRFKIYNLKKTLMPHSYGTIRKVCNKWCLHIVFLP